MTLCDRLYMSVSAFRAIVRLCRIIRSFIVPSERAALRYVRAQTKALATHWENGKLVPPDKSPEALAELTASEAAWQKYEKRKIRSA